MIFWFWCLIEYYTSCKNFWVVGKMQETNTCHEIALKLNVNYDFPQISPYAACLAVTFEILEMYHEPRFCLLYSFIKLADSICIHLWGFKYSQLKLPVQQVFPEVNFNWNELGMRWDGKDTCTSALFFLFFFFVWRLATLMFYFIFKSVTFPT